MKKYNIPGIVYILCIALVCIVYLMNSSKIEQHINGIIFPHGYNKPDDLFYTFLKEDGVYVSQTQKEHFARNGYLATDIGTNNRELKMYAPSFLELDKDDNLLDKSLEYEVHISENKGTTGQTIELHWDDKYWLIGHVSEYLVSNGDKVKTGDVIGISGGCKGNLKLNEASTGCHAHIELRVNGLATPYPPYKYGNHGKNIEKINNYKKKCSDYNSKIEKGDSLNGSDPIYKQYNNWEFISAIHNAEGGRCARDCKMSYAGARGPMQFMENTWNEYGCDGNNDGIIDVENLHDAICGGANYLNFLYKKVKKQRPNIEEKFKIWVVACIYNSGYSTTCTHETAPNSTVGYAESVMNEWLFLKNLQN